jgi:hypothetical protein
LAPLPPKACMLPLPPLPPLASTCSLTPAAMPQMPPLPVPNVPAASTPSWKVQRETWTEAYGCSKGREGETGVHREEMVFAAQQVEGFVAQLREGAASRVDARIEGEPIRAAPSQAGVSGSFMDLTGAGGQEIRQRQQRVEGLRAHIVVDAEA